VSVALNVGEAGLDDDAGQPSGRVVAGAGKAVDELQGEEGGAHQPVSRPAPISDVQTAARPQDAACFRESRALGVGAKVVKQQRHHDAVGARARH
jgi:hypothetical protein